MTTPAVLGERVLRRLGVEIVPVASRPVLATVVSVTSIAERALQGLGVPVAAAVRPPVSAVVTVTSIAERALQGLGVPVAAAIRPPLATVVTPTAIAARALQALGVSVTDANRPAFLTTVPIADIAARALQGLGVTVTDANRPALATIVTMQSIADAALQAVGVTVPAALQPPATATTTTDDIAGQVLVELGVIASDETPSASDLAVVEAKIGSLHSAMVGQGIASWDANAVPIGVIEEYIKLGALVSASSFGKTADPSLWAALEARVRKYSQVKQSQGTEILARVASVHDSLVADGNASWVSTAIPQAAFDEYVALTTAQIAPVFAVTIDPATLPPISARVKRVALLLQSQGLAEDRVAAIHDELVAQAAVSWASTAIPQAASDDYVALTMQQMAPVFGVQAPDADATAVIEKRVKRVALIMQGQTLAEARVATVHDELVGNGYASWALNAIPQAVADDYTALVQFQVSNAFDMHTDVANLVPSLEARVKRFALVLQAQALAEARVNAIHDELVGNGYASWAVSAIPQAVSDDYVALAQLWLAPDFEIKADPAGIPPIEARVKRFALVLQAQTLAEARVNAVHDALVGNAHVSWAASAIPQGVSDDYVALTMIKVAPLFEIKADPAGVPAMEARIRHFSMVQRAPDLATEAIMAVHADLAARGRVRWSSFDIPLAVEQPYILLAAFKLGPEFDRQVSPNDVVMAEKSLARIIALPTSGERTPAQYF